VRHAVARQFVPLVDDAADQRRVAFGDPTHGEQGRLDPRVREQGEHGVGFTINHIAAVVIPAAFGALWMVAPAVVFLAGAAMAAVSLAPSFNVPRAPAPGREAILDWRPAARAAAE